MAVSGPVSKARPSWDQEHERNGDQQEREEQRYRPAGKALLKTGADNDADDTGRPKQEALADVHVSVGSVYARRQGSDHCDRGKRSAGCLMLSVAEPQHQKRDDHGSAADAQERAERPGSRSDRGQPRSAMAEHGGAY